jgi:hypothetical protein
MPPPSACRCIRSRCEWFGNLVAPHPTFELAENAAVWPRCREKEHLALDRTLQLELVKRSREFGSLYFEFHSSGRHFLPVQHEVQLPRAAQISPPAYTCAHH